MQKSHIDLKPSKGLASIFIVLHGLPLFFLSYLALPFPVILGIVFLLVYSLIFCFKYHILRNTSHAISTVVQVDDEKWILITPLGEAFDVQFADRSYFGEYLLILNFELIESKRRRSVVIFSDSISQLDWRRLRAYLLSAPRKAGSTDH